MGAARTRVILLFVFVLLAVAPGAVWAGGFANLDLGATRCSMMAVVAHIDDPTAIYHNPACLTALDGDRLYYAQTSFMLRGRFKVRDYEYNESKWIKPEKFFGVAPFLAYTTDFGTDRWAAGAALYFPNAYGAFLPEDAASRYSLVEGFFVTGNFTPTVAYQLTPEVSLGLGVSYIYVQLLGMRRIHGDILFNDPLLTDYPDPEEDWELEISGEDYVYGWDVGAQWKPSPRFAVGLTYTSESEVTLEGEAKLTDVNKNVSPGAGDLPAIIVAFLGTDTVDVEVGMLVPQCLRLGFLFQVTPKVGIALDGAWWDYSKYKEQKITTKPDLSAFYDLTSQKNYDDSYHLDLGAKWQRTSDTAYMAGLQYDKSPIPDEAYAFENPASDLYGYSLGVRHRLTENLTGTVAWVNNYYEKKNIDNVNYVPNIRPIGEGIMYEICFDLSYTF